MAQEHDWSSVGSPVEANSHDWSSVGDAVDASGKPKEIGGFKAAAKQTIGHSIKGIGQLASDYVGADQDNAVKRYGQSVVDANPTSVHGFGDIVDKPLTTIKEAVGNAAGSMAGIVGSGALGRGIAMIPHPVAKAVGAGIAAAGPIIAGALPSYSGIREAQINDNSGNESDATSKALALAGAGTVGLIESKFGPQEWALSAMTKAGRDKLAQKFGESFAKSVPGAIGKGALRGGAIEGAEELVQNPVEQLASYQNPTTAESLKDTAFGGVMGAIGGGVLGGGMAPIGMKYAESKRQPVAEQPAADKPEIAGLLPAPNYTGTPSDQLLQAEAERQNSVDAAQKNADQLYAERAAYEEAMKALYPSGLPTLTTDPEPLQQRIDEMLGIDQSGLKGLRKVQYQKQLEAAFKEVVGITHDENGREMPLTMGALLDSQAMAEDAAKRQTATENANTRAQGLADEEATQQPDIAPGYVPPVIPVVGPLSAIANAAVQSGAHQTAVMQQVAAQAAKNTPPEGKAGTPAGAQNVATAPAQGPLTEVAGQAPNVATSAPNVATPASAFDVSGKNILQLKHLAAKGQPGWKEAATAELVRLNGSISESVPALNAGNSVNLPVTSISSLQDQLDKIEPFSEQSQLLTERLQLAVTDDAKSAIGAGEMPVYKVTDHVSVAIHPSAQKEGMIQVTRYTKDGVIGDSQYNSIDEAVRFEGLTHKPRIPSNEAIAHIENSIAAEAEYQKRKNEQQAGAGLPAPTAGGSRPAPAVRSDSSLNKTASWVIRNKATGEVVMETYDKAKVDALNTEKYEAVPIQDHLGSLNAKSAANQEPVKNASPSAATVPAESVAPNQAPINQPEQPLDMVPAPIEQPVPEDYKGHLIYQSEMGGGRFMVRQRQEGNGIGGLVGRGFATAEDARIAVDAVSQPKTDTAPEVRKGVRTIDKWTAEELQARLTRGDERGDLSLESRQKIEAQLDSVNRINAEKNAKEIAKAERVAKMRAANEANKGTFLVGVDKDSAERVSVRNGTVYLGDYPAMDYETEDDIAVPEGATQQQVFDALINGKAVTGNSKIFGKNGPEKSVAERMAELDAERAAMSPAERNAAVEIESAMDAVVAASEQHGIEQSEESALSYIGASNEEIEQYRPVADEYAGTARQDQEGARGVVDGSEGEAGSSDQERDGNAQGQAGAVVTETSGQVDRSQWSITPYRYANDSVVLKITEPDGFKGRLGRIAGSIGGRYTNRAGGYVMSETKARKIVQMAKGGWDANSFTNELTAPKAAEQAPAEVGRQSQKVKAPAKINMGGKISPNAKAAEQSPAVDANGDLRGYAYALVKNGQILISGSFPSPKYMEADESSSVTKWQKEADRLGADLYIGGYPGADTFEPQDGLIFGMTFDEIAAKQNKRTIPASINRKMPKDAVLAYEAQAKPATVDAKGNDSDSLSREMAGFTGVSDAEYALRQLSHKEKQEGDIELGNGKFVTLEQAVEAAKKSMDPADWSKPFQFNRVLDIAPIDWNTMVGAMKNATVDAKKQEEAKPVALLSIAGREKFDPISLDTAAGVVARMRQTIKEVWKVDLRLVPTFSALPQEVKDAIAKYGEDTRAKGVLHKGSVYIVADEHASDADVETTILHEIKGHVGLRRLYSDAINKDLGALYMSIGGRRGLADLAKARGFTDELQGYAESLSNSDFTDEERTRIVMEELLSHIAQEPKFGDKAKAIVGKIRAWLRDNGFMALAKFGEADLLNILAKASKALETVRDDNGPVVLMTAWHGSPHDHDKFDSSKIGTGEGAQAYGHGLYFAGERSVAEYYRNAGSSAARLALDALNRSGGIAKEAIKELKKWDGGRNQSDFLDAISLLKTGNQNGRLYQVELAPSEDEYLDWDKPLSEQSDTVKAALDKVGLPKKYHSENKTGSEIYRLLSQDSASHITGKLMDGRGDKAASEYLHSLGIRGIRYLDGSSRSKGEGNSNYVIFSDDDVTITAKYNLADKSNLSPADKAIYGMAAEGKSAAEILKFIASASRNPFNRQVASLLLKTGIAPSITVGDSKTWNIRDAKSGEAFAAAYDPKTNTVALFRPASAERNALHELIHAASLKALAKNGLASAQMKALFAHVEKTGKLTGMYGIRNVDEFIAEAFSNPKFQAALKQVSAAPVGGKPSSEWDWFIRVVRGILGLKQGQDNALSQALDIGIGVMRENMGLNEAPKNANVRGMADKDNVAGTQAPTSAGDGSMGSATIPSPEIPRKLSQKQFEGILQDIDGYGPIEADDPYRTQEFRSIIKRLKTAGIDYIDMYHVTDAGIQDFNIDGIRSSSVDYIGRAGENARASSVYGFLDPDDIEKSYDGILGAESETPNVIHIKVPVENIGDFRWDSNFNLTYGAYSGIRFVGNIPSKWISGAYPYNFQNEPSASAGSDAIRYNAAPGKINQTDTAAFKRWFGDSKVVDANGKPMVVYHGTNTAFGVFSNEAGWNSDPGILGKGFYFSAQRSVASSYGSKLVATYLRIENPLSVDASSTGGFASKMLDAIKAAKRAGIDVSALDPNPIAAFDQKFNESQELEFVDTARAENAANALTDAIQAAGFDGIIYGEALYRKEAGVEYPEGAEFAEGEYIVFKPEQIKSATSNNGSFDGSNPDIRYNVADEGWSASEQAKETVMRLAGRPMLDPADPFAAENARLREQDQSLWSKAKKQLRRYLAPGGLLPQSVFAEKIKRDSEFQAVEFDVRHLIGGLERAVKTDFGMSFDKLSKEQMRPITEALAGNVPASLPEATKTAAVAMRQYIDGMSTEYLKIIQQKIDAKMLKAIESGKDADKAQAINEIELFEKIKGNIGRYVHRSYQAFDDPKWFEKVPALVLNASRLYLKQGYMEAGETDAKAAQLAEVALHEILKNGTAYDSMESFIAESKLGAKDLSVLMRRKEVPAQIRALLGEYPDARLNFTKSATKMGRLIWNTRFLDRVRDMGMGSFFFEGKDRPPNATTQIAADGSEVYAPLNGLWTFPETAQAFKDALGKEQMSDLYRAIVRANGLVKYGKTVLAPTTAMRNWQSAMLFSLANGHFDLTQMKKSISAFREQVSQKATGQDLKYLRHLKQLGVVYDTPYAGEMARLMEDARMEELLSSDKGDAVRWFRKANQLAQGFYTFGDDFWKIIGFENEKAGLMKAGLSLQEAEIEAAKRIRDTYPTYSMVGRGVQWLSRFPLAGTFVSFPAEIIRTSGNMLRTVAADLKSDNPKLRELGMKRAAGMVFVSAAFYSLAALSMAMAGVGDDEDEAIRDLAPEWQKNSTFLYLGRDEKGNLRYFDTSFLDPYGYWKRPITAMLRNQPWEDSLASGLRGMLEPFLGADISAKAIFEAVANQKESGGKVYKEKDGAIDQAVDIADHLRKALQPGVVGNVERLVKAASDVRKSSGQPYSMEDELVALAGWRATTIEPKTALYYRSFEFTDSIAEARKTLTDTLRDANDVSPEDIKDARERAKSKQEQAFKEMSRLVGAAEAAGMSKMQIVQTLRLSNISQANIASLMRGSTPDVSITPQLAARAVRQASQMRGPEFAADVFDRYRQAMAK